MRCQARRLDIFFFPLLNDIRASVDHVMCQAPTPLGTLHLKCADRTPLLAHYIWNVQTRYVPRHIAYVMCEASTPFSTLHIRARAGARSQKCVYPTLDRVVHVVNFF